MARAAVEQVSWEAALAFRMERQHLAARAPASALVDVVADLCGLQAQVLSSAVLTAWARIDGLDAGAVERALWEERTLVKTWAMRGTLHLLPVRDLGLWVGAQGALRPRYEQPTWLRHFGLTREEAEALVEAVPRVLERGTELTRSELADAVAHETGVGHLADGLRRGFGDLLKPVAFRGDLCFAPGDGQRVRFARSDRFVGPWEPVPVEDAAREAARRYLRAYGPATREWLARWFGMTSAPLAGRWLRALGDDAVEVEVAGTTAWLLADDVDVLVAARPSGTVRLLPAFDQHVVTAPRDVDALVPVAFRDRVYRPQGWLSPVVAVDGAACAVWRHEADGGTLRVAVEPFARPSAAVREGVRDEVARLAAFLELDVSEPAWAAP